METTTYPWPVKFLPANLACAKDDKAAIDAYNKLTNDQKKASGFGLWWSLHDISTVFGGSLFGGLENDANYFNFIIDFSAPEIKNLQNVESTLANSLNSLMSSNLTGLSTKIGDLLRNQQLASSATLSSTMINVAAANRPSQIIMPAAGVADPNAAALGPVVPGAVVPEPIYSVKNLEAECLKDLSKVPITSKSRIFVVQDDLIITTAEMNSRLKFGDFEKLSQLVAPPIAPPGVVQAAGQIKTRKERKKNRGAGAHKKRKTQRQRKLYKKK